MPGYLTSIHTSVCIVALAQVTFQVIFRQSCWRDVMGIAADILEDRISLALPVPLLLPSPAMTLES